MPLSITLICDNHIPISNTQLFNDATELERYICMNYQPEDEIDIYVANDVNDIVWTTSPNEVVDLAFMAKYFS